jgi:hypothetical protein
MITPRKLAYEFRRMMAGGDPGPDFHIPEAYAILLARQGLQALVAARIFPQDQDDRSNAPMYIAQYEVNVLGEFGHQYLDLPDWYLRMPFNKGLHGIAPVQEPTQHYIPRHNPQVTYNLDCADVEGQRSYWVIGQRVHLDKEEEKAKLLVYLLIPAPDSIGDDDPLPMFPEQQFELLGLMRQLWANEPIQDKIIDGNKDIGIKLPR